MGAHVNGPQGDRIFHHMFQLISPNQKHPRDYHEELKGALMVMDPAFQLSDLNMWKENIPNSQQMSDGELCKADDKIDELMLSQNKLSFDADALALARDAAQLATLYREEQKTDRSARLAKVLHLKQQNQIGSTLTMDFMRKRCYHVAGPVQDLSNALDKVEGLKHECFPCSSPILPILQSIWKRGRLEGFEAISCHSHTPVLPTTTMAISYFFCDSNLP